MATELEVLRQEEYYYDVTGALKDGEEAYAPNLTAPDKSWFYDKPSWWGNVDQYSLTVDEEGRVAGLIANWDACYLNNGQQCIKPFPIKDNERFVYQGNVAASMGEKVPVSIIAATKGHNFSDDVTAVTLANQGFLDDKFQPLESSHDIMAHQLMYGRYVNVEEGIAFLGAVFPHVSAAMVHRINASAVSAHWVYDIRQDDMLFAGAVFVNQGALPLESKSNLQLRQIAASLRYNHIMAGEVVEACTCKKNIAAATDPNYQNATGQPDAVQPTLTIDDIAHVVDQHSQEIDVIEQVLMDLIKEVDFIKAAQDADMAADDTNQTQGPAQASVPVGG